MKKIFTLLSFSLVLSLSAQDITEGLVIHYPLDGNFIEAISGEEAVNNGNLTFEDGQEGSQAVRFTDQDAYFITTRGALQVGLEAEGGTAGTFAMFVNHRSEPLDTDRQNYIAQKNGCGDDDNNRGRVVLYRQNPNNASDPDSIISFIGGQPLRTGYKLDMADTWIHLAFTIDPEIQEWAFYVDGVEVMRESSGGTPENSCGEFVIGHHLTFTNDGQTFDGLMDEVRFYDRVLSTEEIGLLANQFTTATKEILVSDAVTLSPNPVATNQPINLTIDNTVFTSGSPITVSIMDATGNSVVQRQFDTVGENVTIDHDLQPGLYTLGLTDGEKRAIVKVVVQ